MTYPHSRFQSAHPNGTYAIHPISGTTPNQSRYTRSEEVQCLRIGCSTQINRKNAEHARPDILLIQAAAPVGGGKARPGVEIDHSEL